MTTDEEIALVAKIAAIVVGGALGSPSFKRSEAIDIAVDIARQIVATAAKLQFEEGTVLL